MPTRRPHSSHNSSFVHIPIESRECFRLGLARRIKKGGSKLAYDWPSIRELWLVDPAGSVQEFAEKYHIPDTMLYRDAKLSAEHKQEITGIIRNGFTLRMIRKMVVQSGIDLQSSAGRVARIIDNLAVFSESASIFARARMIKLDPQGNESVNVDCKSSDVKHYSSIARDIADTLRSLMEIRIGMGLDNTKERHTIDEIVIEPPKSMSKRAAKVPTPAGAAPAGTSTDAQATQQATPANPPAP